VSRPKRLPPVDLRQRILDGDSSERFARVLREVADENLDENLDENQTSLARLEEPPRLPDGDEPVPDEANSDELLRTVAAWCMSERQDLDEFITEALRVRQELADSLGRDVSEIAVPALGIHPEKPKKAKRRKPEQEDEPTA